MTVFDRLRRDPQGLGMTSQRARDRLLERLKQEGIRDPRVLDVIRTVPRHLFVNESLSTRAYEDSALPIGLGQTISQPYVVARMTEALIEHGIPNKVLEIGTGSGYQAAVLAPLVPQVFTVERILKHLTQARRRLRAVGAANVRSRHDDGRRGWPEEAPFDGIVVTAAAESVEQTLIDQLAPGGVLIAPLGPSGAQELIRIRKLESGVTRERLGGVSFVPLLPGLA
jgi:protein-L-isoaspartate(D-aspartate) O-methyltransferase